MNRRGFLKGGALASPLLVVSATASGHEYPMNADVGFCRDMSAHHLQALTMCQRVLGRPTGDPVQAAAAEVLQNQAMEIGQMRAWLTDWGESTVVPAFVMGWMGMEMPLSEMPGYATDDELRELSLLQGEAQGRRWLELMRAHHVGGVQMADMAVAMASIDKVRRLAELQSQVQSFEIAQYDVLLAGPYAP